MNILEKIVKEANEGGLARIEKAVECAENVATVTENYSKAGPERKDGMPTPPIVSAEDIKTEMEKDNRERAPIEIEQEEMPYFTEDSKPIIESEEER